MGTHLMKRIRNKMGRNHMVPLAVFQGGKKLKLQLYRIDILFVPHQVVFSERCFHFLMMLISIDRLDS